MQKEHRCNFIVKSGCNAKRCGLVFESKKKLASHKQQANHLQRKRKIGPSLKAAASEPKQLRLEETTLALANLADNEQQDDETCNLCMSCLLDIFSHFFCQYCL